MSVATKPGATEATAMPYGARATARDWPIELRAAFDAPYAGCVGSPRKAPRDDTLMIRPPRSRMCWAAAQAALAAPNRLTSKVSPPRLLPLLVVGAEDRMRAVHAAEDAGVVHQHVEATELVCDAVDHGPYPLGVCHVGPDHDVAGAGQLGRELLGQGGRVAVMHRDPVPAGREPGGDGPAQASG